MKSIHPCEIFRNSDKYTGFYLNFGLQMGFKLKFQIITHVQRIDSDQYFASKDYLVDTLSELVRGIYEINPLI